METMTPFIRIGLRIFGGFMIGQGWADEEIAAMLWADPQVVGIVALGISEGWYLLAKRFDWAK